MFQKTKLLFMNTLTNSLILILLFIGIQNSNKKNKVNFLYFESAKIPVGFILGISFFAGSTIGSSIITLNRNHKNQIK